MKKQEKTKSRTMAAGAFKAKCLKVMDEVKARREPVIVTKRGKPIVKVVPVEEGDDPIFGFMKGKIEVNGDIVGPVLTLEEWGNLA